MSEQFVDQGATPNQEPNNRQDGSAIGSLQGSLSEPERARERSFSPDIYAAIRAYQAELFCDSGESLLSNVYFAAHAILDPEFTQFRDEYTDELFPLGEETRALIKQGDEILGELEEQIDSGDNDTIGDIVEEKLRPLLRELESIVDRWYRLNCRAIQDWLKVHNVYTNTHLAPAEEEGDEPCLVSDPSNPIDHSNIYATQHQKQYESLKGRFQEYQFDSTLKNEPNDGNRLLLDLALDRGVELEFNEGNFLVEMNPDHLHYVCTSVCKSLSRVGNQVHRKAIRTGFSENSYFALSEAELESNNSFAQVEHSFFGDKRISGRISDGDRLILEYPAPKCFANEWDTALQDLHQRLAPVSSIVSLYNGGIDIKRLPEDERVQVSLTLPMRSDPNSESAQNCEDEYKEKAWRYNRERSPAMDHIEFERDVMLDDGTCKTYVVQCPGAALLAAGARIEMREILARADEFIRLNPELNSLNLSAGGTAEEIDQAFRSGNVSISLAGDLRGESEKNTRGYTYFIDTFSWEVTAGTSQRSLFWPISMDIYRLSFTQTSFFDDTLKDYLETILSYANPLLIPCEHDQESEYVSGEEKTDEMIRSMLGDLARVLGEIQAVGEHGRLSIRVMQLMDMGISEIGSRDGLFAFHAFNEQGQVVAKGVFGRESLSWKWHRLNEEEIERLASMIEEAISSLKAEEIRFRNLDNAFREKNIELPDTLIMSIVEAAQEETQDDFTAPSIECVVAGFLEDAYTEVQFQDGCIVVVQEDSISPETSSFGVIFDCLGGNPREVANYNVAKKLHEGGSYLSFQPNELFFKKYEEER